MRFFVAALALAAPALVSCSPVKVTRQQGEATVAVLKFAAVLETLETAFYTQALEKFKQQDFVDAGITVADVAIEAFTGIQQNEAAHTDVLVRALHDNGDQEITSCSVNFGGALDSVATMVATARVLELVGVGAYIGGAELLTDKNFLAAAASILTIEARHQSLINSFNSASNIPQAFDFGFTPGEVLTLAGGFVSGCDIAQELNFDGLGLDGPKPPLQIKNTGVVNAGTKLEFDSPALQGQDLGTLSCQMIVGGAAEAQSFPANDCIVPNGIEGPVAIFLTSDSQPLQSNVFNRLAKDASKGTVAGPTIAFIDVKVDALGALIRSNPNPVESSQTISPDEAQQQLNSASTENGFSEATSTLSSEGSFQTSAPQNASDNNGSNSDILVIGVTFVPA